MTTTAQPHLAPLQTVCSTLPSNELHSFRDTVKRGRDSTSHGSWLKYNDILDVISAELESREAASQKA